MLTPIGAFYAAVKEGGQSVEINTFEFYEGSSGGMSHRWDGTSSEFYDATKITVTFDFSSGTSVSRVGIDSRNVDATVNSCSGLNCGSNSFDPVALSGTGSFLKEFSGGYWGAAVLANINSANNYMAGGTWSYLPKSGNYRDLELGSFVYASSLAKKSGVGALNMGTAVFSGITYGKSIGSEDGVYYAGDIFGNVALTADFVNDNISGRLSDLRISSIDENGIESPADCGSACDLEDITLTVSGFKSSYLTNGYVSSTEISWTNSLYTTSGSWGATFAGSETSVTSTIDLTGIAGTYGIRVTEESNISNWSNLYGVFLANDANAPFRATFDSLKSGGTAVSVTTFAFYEGSGGGMSHRWDGSSSSTFDATSITVTLSFSSGTTIASMGIDSRNVDATVNSCSGHNCPDNRFDPGQSIGGTGFFLKEFSGGYWGAQVYANVTTTTDYMTGGTWSYLPKSGNFQDMEMGSFVYASSLAKKSDVGALSAGMAVFSGITYGELYGPDDGDYYAGDIYGNVTLTANFATDNISGRLSDLTVSWVDENGNESPNPCSDCDYEDFTLTANGFKSSYLTNGYVKSTGIASTDSELTTSGSWAATFTGSESSVTSTINLTGIAGTYGARITNSSDSSNWANLFGVFLAGKD